MKKLLIVLSILTSSTFAQREYRVITADQIKSNGCINISDMLKLNTNWDYYTVDGVNYSFTINNLSGFDESGFGLMINGQPVDLSYIEQQNIDLLPFTIDQIDSVLVVDTPQMYRGVFTRTGLIDIYIRQPQEGFSVSAVQSIGNETGDPGPYAYTPYTTANVDKLGYLAGLNFNSLGNNWKLAANFKYRENFTTDKQIRRRILNSSADDKAQLIGTSMNLSFDLLKGTHQIFFAYTQHDEFTLLPLLGNEIPATRIFRHIGIDGTFEINRNLSFNYFMKDGLNDFIDRDNYLGLDYDLRLKTFTGRIEGNYKFNKNLVATGIEYEKRDGNRSGFNNDELFLFIKFYTDLHFYLTHSLEQSIGFYSVKNEERLYYNGYLNTTWIFGRTKLSLNTAYSEFDLLQQNNYWSWSINSQSNIQPELEYLPGVTNTKMKLYSIDLFLESTVSNSIDFQISGNFRYFKDYFIENSNYTYNREKGSISGNIEFAENQNLKVAGGTFKISQKLTETIQQQLSYSYTRTISGTNEIKDQWKVIPIHKILYHLNFVPFDDFGINSTVRYNSEKFWTSYKFVDLVSVNKFRSTIDNQLLVDLSFYKWFWGKQIWTNLMIKNIFNQPEYYHPLGAHLDLRFYLQVQLYLRSIFN